MKTLVYTAIFGEKDTIKEPKNYLQNHNLEYFCFTDNTNLISEHYRIIITDPIYKDITKNARKFKILGFKGIDKYDYAIWHDANLRMDDSKIQELTYIANQCDIATFKHPYRVCAYKEAIEVIKLNKDYPLRVFRQTLKLFFNNYPVNAGLFETSILVKNLNSKSLYKFSNEWWYWVYNYSRRDQLSFDFSRKENKILVKYLSGARDNNEYSDCETHCYKEYRDEFHWHFFDHEFVRRFFIFLIRILRKLRTYI